MKKILYIFTGSIAAEKSLQAALALEKYGFKLSYILTKSAHEFLSAKHLKKLHGKKYSELFVSKGADEMDHINLSREADLIIVAPASANFIAKIANGIADDLASTSILAADKKIIVVPAMNVKMWENPVTTRNIELLKNYGIEILGPTAGDLACGEVGLGRMVEAQEIATKVKNYFTRAKQLHGLKAIVTAGPTLEKLDPVRFISNFSSGKQGYAIAAELAARGAKVKLISGPVNLSPPHNVEVIKIESADEMLKQCQKNLPADIAIFTAAVADFKPSTEVKNKIKKEKFTGVSFTKNPDILATIATHKKRPKLVIGFAAETENVLKNAKAKLKNKKADWVLANDISKNVFGADENEIDFVTAKNSEHWPRASKSTIAELLADKISAYFLRKLSN